MHIYTFAQFNNIFICSHFNLDFNSYSILDNCTYLFEDNRHFWLKKLRVAHIPIDIIRRWVLGQMQFFAVFLEAWDATSN